MEDDPYEKDMENFNLNDDRGHHWRMVSENNGGGVDNAKALIHDKRWDLYVNEK